MKDRCSCAEQARRDLPVSDATEPKRGDVRVDADGSRWIVTWVAHDGQRVSVGRVREGSLAARVIFGKAKP